MSAAKWKVTDDGLECGSYHIGAERLNEMRDGKYEWPMHLCIKSGFDAHDFFGAFETALERHGHAVNEDALLGAWDWCLKRIKQSDEYAAIAREMFPEKFRGISGMWQVSEMRAVAEEQRKRRDGE
ncbi:hypothetical protein [Rhizobium sp. BR 315]|uniref:hypothetical protein n=1 Tax=Rhizobium sp. BR 315 TaxID=3040014 RepID=UPI003D32F2EE